MIRRELVFLLALAAVVLSMQVVCAAPLVQWGSVWKYLDNGTDQSNAWRSVDYEDDGWSSGPAQLGYGDGDEATEVGWGTNASSKYITTYFRQWFSVPDPSALTNLVLRLLRDDGAIVYINGVEVYRSNMPDGDVDYVTRASASSNATRTNNVSPSVLVPGANLIAVEVHQNSSSSGDISFDLELTDGRNDTPTVSITSPANNSSISTPGNITINVSATDPNGTITNVLLYSGNLLIGQKTNVPFTFVWSNVPPGAYVIGALARDNDGLLGVSTTRKFTVGSGLASNLVLLPFGSTWKYRDDGSNQGTAWTAPGFNDSAWTNGPAQLGYGDGDEARVISYGGNSSAKHTTTYFRKSIVISNLAAVTDLVLDMILDDGAVVHINGTEVMRTNLPTGTITYTNFADSTWENEPIRAVLDKSVLVEGTNVVAVEVHQVDAASSDLSFDLRLNGTDLPSVIRGPWLQAGSWTNIIVKWRTDASVTSRVRFGLDPTNLQWSVRSTSLNSDHRIVLTNLAPSTRYYYSVGTTNATLLGDSSFVFTTSPPPGARKRTRVWALGDCGTANVDQFNVRDAFYRHLGTNELDLMLLLGDNAYNSGLDSEFQEAIFDTYPVTLRQTPLWSTIGNHETDQSSSPSSTIAYYQIFSLPKDGEVGGVASGTEDYYSFDYANIHFVCLDSMTSGRTSTGTMATWLNNDLNSTTQAWIVAFWHHPPYTKGSHNSDTESNLIDMRQNLVPILENHGVDLVLCGHSHAYERSHLLDGHYGSSGGLNATNVLDSRGGRANVAGPYLKPLGLAGRQGAVYVVAGSAGKTSGGALNHPAMFVSYNRLGSLYFEINGDRLDAQFVRETGVVADYFTILKGGVPYQLTRSGNSSRITWNTVSGLSYLVDYKDDLNAAAWTTLGSAIAGTGSSITLTNDTVVAQRYYRIRTQ
jgi:hypothetical protein